MQSDNIRAAIQIDDLEAVEEAWKRSRFYDGSMSFYEFITTPSAERTLFVGSRRQSHKIEGAVVITSIR